MKTSDFFYELPEELIAQIPAEPRDSSRLMVYHRKDGRVEDRIFRDIIEYLRPGDALVINETRVLPVRLIGRKRGGSAEVECLLLKRLDGNRWEALIRPAKRLREGMYVDFSEDLCCSIEEKRDEGIAILNFEYEGVFENLLEEYGAAPLPPYIHQENPDKKRYQTVYARINGSAAAPTAGFHFTKELMDRIREKGVEIIPVLLHVGLGTFRPVKVEDVTKHKMHSEYYEVSEESAGRINRIRENGGRIIAVGTTSVRTLESAADDKGKIHSGSGETEIFIYPGYTFKCVDALITNFHLPESTLIMLVAAMVGREKILELYNRAVSEKYRFFSFGDAMFIE
ncbi:MAG: tRNA preQ1(34) S-adenosylmethionine ribosyltransferase-isomerase QueA [Clostridia bacterium]|jgi:S-adenosylmethionine:tRNA ribosyltransferase-isomerase|nr:tRNA preQ1(34) S-adenosylmethionine ribosyltransferase-isomerase QueA [Clostridia bacterium]MBQ5956949.1 tRNA preQ1(34) S-adenosylmethionine ribosyltransferase-isomerase QueA [Clostridia bacterium]MBQ6003332.1 tRNA preQ1(34) S-adenosylmethionine ribosyltransferase-isomerase QueA [Clostridia bacterium]MBR0437649.1 tRNA preQ1(34) S-adenosylmethionine ribosyltransferase-isomerase QueA [Clostridia bacterium]MBR4622925.1 tRNA preQ1(34) S-adenosylmethionine ribosyltransferase-isomerase QueA [Clost